MAEPHLRNESPPIRANRRLFLALVLGLALCASSCGVAAVKLSRAAQDQRDALIKQGLSAQRAGNPTRAAAAYARAIAIDGRSAVARYDLGDVEQLDFKQLSRAAGNYRLALVANPNLAPALFNLAILETAHSPKAAASAYRRLISIDHRDAAAIWNLGYVLVSLNEVGAGNAEIARAVLLDPALSTRVPPAAQG